MTGTDLASITLGAGVTGTDLASITPGAGVAGTDLASITPGLGVDGEPLSARRASAILAYSRMNSGIPSRNEVFSEWPVDLLRPPLPGSRVAQRVPSYSALRCFPDARRTRR